MAQAANTADFLGEGTAATVAQAPALTQAQIDAAERAKQIRRLQQISNAAAQTANVNNNPTGDYQTGRTTVSNNVIDPKTGQPYVYAPVRGPSFTSTILPTLKAISKDPVTAGILAAPYGVLGAGAALGGLASGGAGTLVDATAAGFSGAAPAAAAAGGAAAGTAAGAGAGAAAAGGGLTAGQVLGGALGVGGIAASTVGLLNRPGAVKAAPLPPVDPANQAAIQQSQATAAQQSGNIALQADRVRQVADQVASQQAPNYAAQGTAAGARAAPQIQETGSGAGAQQAALQGAQNFRPNDSGAAGIRAATADTSGAAALQNFRTDPNGIAALDKFSPQNANAGIQQLQNFQSTNTQQGVNALNQYQNPNAAVGQLQGFQGDQRGVNALNAYAAQPEGPSAAQALLQAQSDKDVRTAIALARSARGGPAAVAAAQRQAQSEGAAIEAETRGQAAALRAQETDTFKQRQLTAINAAAQAGLSASGQNLMALQASGQLISDQNAQQLQAKQAAGQLLSQADAQKLSAYQAATQALSTQDQQILQATTAATQARAQADATRQTALANAANVKLQGSAINQQGQIAATNAELTASGQKLQALSLQGQISDQIRTADIDVLKSNLSAQLQQLNLNDTQVRAFAQMQEDARQADQNAQLQAAQLGLNAAQVQSAVDLGWQQFAQSQLTQAQQFQIQQQGLAQGVAINNQNVQQQNSNALLQFGGTALAAAGKAISDERAKKNIRPVSGRAVAQALRDSPGSSYEYTEPDKPGRAPGRHITPMAQGLRKSALFAPAVSARSDGTLEVDGTRLALAQHTAIAHLQKEIDQIKKHRKARREVRA